MTPPDVTRDLRRAFYGLLTCVGVAVCVGKIVGAENLSEPSRHRPPTPHDYGADRDLLPRRVWPATRPEPTPMFGSNDKSRFATVKALVENGTYVVGRRDNFTSPTNYRDEGVIFAPGYESLDKVMDPGTGEFYSSKPPLFPTLVAGEYWLLHRLGLSIDRHRWWVVGIALLTFNALPFAVYLGLLASLIESYGRTDFGRLFTFTVAASATFLTTFSVTLNNHTPAACCVVFALYPLLRPGASDTPLSLAAAGFFAGLATTFEMPAASLLVGLFVPLAVARRSRALWYVAGAALPVAAFFITNYAAMGRWLPAYGEFRGPWYDFPGSHWAKLKLPDKSGLGIDFADEPKWLYAFHLTIGHHGWFSLTPVWLLGLGGLVASARHRIREWLRAPGPATWTSAKLAALTLAVSAVVFGFYVSRTNNYGGYTSCARWLMWLTPLWLLGTLPAADAVGRSSAGRLVAGLLLAASVFSVMYPAWNPWRPPWILQLCELMGWVRY